MTHTRTLTLCGVMLAAGGLTLGAQQSQEYAPSYARMTGTYQLEIARGDDPHRAADVATRGLSRERRDRAYQNLLTRLEPPQTLAIDRRGRMITISSSSGPRAAFDADGQVRDEPGPNGRLIRTRAEIIGDRLSVSTTGNRGSDFSVTFESINNGDRLRVTRRFDNDELTQPVTLQSFYRRTSNEPRWDLYSDAPRSVATAGSYDVSDGTRLIATLDTPLSTRSSRSGERFTMTVRSPQQFEGARIDGIVSRVNPDRQADNRADVIVDFETIHFRGGPTADFRAILNSVRTPDGQTLRVDAEGGVRDRGTSDERIEHGAIGAALGAIIGAVAGGGKGAAVGAVIGGAGGAILVEGRDQLDLPPGTEMTMTATSPRYR
ncbi:MAG TPA: hypothetical protein VFA59_09400 [Vicinamibacterales bacterium]|nr:hypothetical protein [Vicinamibacterales bacterium]